MVNKIIDGISIKLNQVFGSGYKIYSESIKQGLKEPCFFIIALNPSEESVLSTRFFRQCPFDIHYFPVGPDSNAEMQAVAESMYMAMEWIEVEANIVRGVQMNHQVIDGVLHFFVQYNMHIIKPVAPADSMETLDFINGIEE